MKKLLLCLMLVLCGATAFAQSQMFKVVSDENEALPYATVYINGKAYATANKVAVVNIPREVLSKGDTISASYVGYQNKSVLYDGYRKGGYVIRLDMGQLESVKIYGRKETRKEFRTINSLTPMARSLDYSFRFVVDIDGKEACRGDLYHYLNVSAAGLFVDYDSSENKILGTSHNRLYVEPAEKHLPALGDENKVKELREIIMPALQDVYYSASRGVATDLMYINQCGVQVRKTNEKGKLMTFMLSRESNGRTYDKITSSTVYVDVDTVTNNVVEARIDIMRGDERLELTATYLTHKDYRYPNVIEATLTKTDGTTYTIDIYDVYIMKKKEKVHVFKKSNSVNIWDMDNEMFFADASLRYTKGQYSESVWKDIQEEFETLKDLSDMAIRERLEVLALINSVE